MLYDVTLVDAAGADELIECRQRGGQLRARHYFCMVDRNKRMSAARIRAIAEAEQLRETVGMSIHLPAGGAVHACFGTEDVPEADTRAFDLMSRPPGISFADVILPEHMIVGMDADLEAQGLHGAHNRCATLADVGPGQHGAIQQRSHPIVGNDGSAPHFAQEAFAKYALDRAAGVIETEAE